MVKRISIFSSFACFTRVRRAWKERTRRSKHNKKILWKYLEEGKRTQTFNIPQMRSAKLRNNQDIRLVQENPINFLKAPLEEMVERGFFREKGIEAFIRKWYES